MRMNRKGASSNHGPCSKKKNSFTVRKKYILDFSDNHLNYTSMNNDKSKSNDVSKGADALEGNRTSEPDHELIRPVYGKDAPLELIEEALKYAKGFMEKPDIFLYTGDSNSHPVFPDFADLEHVIERVTINIQRMHHYYKNSVWVTSMIGNNDATPSYYMDIPGEGEEISTVVKIAGAWKDTITDKDMKQFKLHGYVAYPVDNRLVVITLNTAVYLIYHEPQSLNLDDPLGQFKWLKDELKEMKRRNQVAFLCGHIPPSLDSHVEENQWKVEYIEMYKEIIKDYSDIIRAQLFGHLHRNEVRFSPDGNFPPLFITTALSPRYNNNPAFIVWEYDPTSYELCDFVLHGTDINDKEPYYNWKALFRATKAYNLMDLSSKSWKSWATEIENDFKMIEKYRWYSKAQSPVLKQACETYECYAKALCSLYWWSTKDAYDACCIEKTALLETKRTRPLAIQSKRLLLPATKTINNQKPDYSTWTFATVFLTVILLGLIIFELRKLLGSKLRSQGFLKAEIWERCRQ